jgi:hypothetical protein
VASCGWRPASCWLLLRRSMGGHLILTAPKNARTSAPLTLTCCAATTQSAEAAWLQQLSATLAQHMLAPLRKACRARLCEQQCPADKIEQQSAPALLLLCVGEIGLCWLRYLLPVDAQQCQQALGSAVAVLHKRISVLSCLPCMGAAAPNV